MKTLFVHASVKAEIKIPSEILAPLPNKLGLFTTIQFLKQLPKVKRQLEEMGKEVVIIGQTLGCRADAAKNVDVEAFLYIGSGSFHPLLVGYQTSKPVYCYHPIENKLTQIDQKEIDEYHKLKKVKLMKFLHADRVGVLISTKVGQNDNKINAFSTDLKMKGPLELLARHDKEYYLFAFNTLNLSYLEDFPFIDFWVNTACSRIADEKNQIVNLDDLRAYFHDPSVVSLR
jgi:2-(3-amino-3-carboxypropyl)histidine synthase